MWESQTFWNIVLAIEFDMALRGTINNNRPLLYRERKKNQEFSEATIVSKTSDTF